MGGDIENLLIIYRTLTAIFASGIYTFSVFIMIGYISIYYPEGLLLSHTQFINAIKLYKLEKQKQGKKESIKDLSDYVETTRKLLDI